MQLIPRRLHKTKSALVGPQADPSFAAIAAPEIRHRVRLAHVVHHIQQFSRTAIGHPLGSALLKIWLHNWPGARWVEKMGLPRHNLEVLLGPEAFILRLNPRSLIQFSMHPEGTRKKPSSVAFIWDGDWDLCRVDLRKDYALKFVRDIDTHRHDLEKTRKYRDLTARIDAGRPFHSHQEGFYLNTPERVLAYLEIYLEFLDNMARCGYDEHRAKDHPGVAISRHGRILKAKRGAHRLAMAQWLGLPEIPVKVHHIHRKWWDQVTQGTHGRQALERVQAALLQATPEQELGPLSTGTAVPDPDAAWPDTSQAHRH